MSRLPLNDAGLMIIANTPFLGALCRRLRDGPLPPDDGLTAMYLSPWITSAADQLLGGESLMLDRVCMQWFLAPEHEQHSAAQMIVDAAIEAGRPQDGKGGQAGLPAPPRQRRETCGVLN